MGAAAVADRRPRPMTEVAGPDRLRQLLDAVLAIASDLDLSGVLESVVESAVRLVDARDGALGVLDDTGTKLAEFITVGMDGATRQARWRSPDGPGVLRVPIRVRGRAFGHLYLNDKQTGLEFSAVDEELVVGLATAAAVAIENAQLHVRVQSLGLVEERDRIARDLHDTVIQRLFATGMSLQGSANLVETDPEQAIDRIEAAVTELDLTVTHIRTAIFGLEQQRIGGAGLRERVLVVTQDAATQLGFEPRVVFDGPVDTGVDDRVGTELLGTLREALSNVARHAHATRVDVDIVVDAQVCLLVADDGVGPPDADDIGGNGLRNMAARATGLGGEMTLTAGETTGTVLEWRTPRQ